MKKESSKIQEAKPVATKDSKVQIVEAKSATHNTVKAAEPAAQTASTGATKNINGASRCFTDASIPCIIN